MPKTYQITQFKGVDRFPLHVGPTRVEGNFHEHTHAFVELVVITGGRALHVVNGRRYEIGAGDVYVLSGGAVHAFEDAQALELVNVMYAPSMLSALDSEVRSLPGYQALFVISPSMSGEYRCTMRLNRRSLQAVMDVLATMGQENRATRPGHQTVLRAGFAHLVVLLARHYSRGDVRVRGPGPALRLADVVGYLESHYRERLTIDSLADRAGLSRRHFLRLFGRLYGTTPIRYQSRLRLARACDLLRNTDLGITRVAFECGYEDSNYFSRSFSKKQGCSPREYRARSPSARQPQP
jgi:AraC family transcriptional regulator, L-rhamnose operon regulatory protein RhaS